ncbi:MAG: Dolichyl-phosphate-mannose-protein mannosyltransferase [Pseudonocardiales bacterium]|nr:Dolichyl-phosphate-mannose-protein mannosyltransferase [Pseudonocardiales bacterium]
MPRAAQRGVGAPVLDTLDPPPEVQDRTWLARATVATPESIASAVAGFCIGPMVLLLLGHFTAPLAIPLGCLGALVAVWCCGVPTGRVSRLDVACTLAAIAVAVAWLAYNIRYTAQDVYATRDPATYTITGRWLVDHASLQIHTHPEIFGSPPGAEIASGSYAQVSGDVLNGQGNHLLSALLALAGSVFGTGAIFGTNTVLAALALYVFFGVARRVVAAPLALLAMTAFAVSMPLVYVSRDAFSEPLTMLFLMGSLALVHRAFASRRIADFALAGLVGGSSAMARIDSYAALLALVFAAIVVAALAPVGQRRAASGRALALLVGAAVPTLLGWLDLTHLARQYFDSQHHNITLLLTALGALLLIAPVLVWLAWLPRVRTWLTAARVRQRIAVAVSAVVVLAFAFLASRPLWQATRGPRRIDLENMQARWGATVDGTRTYEEQSVHWLALYVGWPTVVLAVAGYIVLVGDVVRRRAYSLVGVLAMGFSLSALYLWNCQVAPDQPWAMRRYVPVVLPLLLVAASAGLQALWRWQRLRVVARSAVIVLAAVLLGFPAATMWPMRHVRDEVPQLTQVNALCSAIGPRGAVVEVDPQAIFGYGQTLRSYCNVPTIGLVGATPVQLADMRRSVAAHGRVLYVLSQDNARTTRYATPAPVAPFSVVTVQRWPTQINVAPREPDTQTYAMFLSTVDAAGLAHPVPPGR